MPNWAEVLKEIKEAESEYGTLALDQVRRKYLKKLNSITNRNIIAFYSGWLDTGFVFGSDINDRDINGFMLAINHLDCAKGLDLILHTQGGSISVTEHLVGYLKKKFGNDIRAIVPQIAMSAGTMICLSCKDIIMGKQSCLGPIDPQVNGIPASRVIDEFERAVTDAQNRPQSIPIWQAIISKYHPTFLDSCRLACERSTKITREWLTSNMFSADTNKETTISNIVDYFNDSGHDNGHDKHISMDKCLSLGLKIKPLEEDQNLQDTVLTIHHTYMHTISKAMVAKVIENHIGEAIFNFAR